MGEIGSRHIHLGVGVFMVIAFMAGIYSIIVNGFAVWRGAMTTVIAITGILAWRAWWLDL